MRRNSNAVKLMTVIDVKIEGLTIVNPNMASSRRNSRGDE